MVESGKAPHDTKIRPKAHPSWEWLHWEARGAIRTPSSSPLNSPSFARPIGQGKQTHEMVHFRGVDIRLAGFLFSWWKLSGVPGKCTIMDDGLDDVARATETPLSLLGPEANACQLR